MTNEIFQKANNAFQAGATNEEVFSASRGSAGLSQEEMGAEGPPTKLGEYMPEPEPTASPKKAQYFEDAGAIKPSDYRPQDYVASELAGIASYVAPVAGVEPLEAFQRVKADLTAKGHSDLLARLESLAIADRSQVTRELFTDVITAAGQLESTSPEDMQAIVSAYEQAITKNRGPFANYEALYEMVAANLVVAPEEDTPEKALDEGEKRIQLNPVNMQERLTALADLPNVVEQTINEVVLGSVGNDPVLITLNVDAVSNITGISKEAIEGTYEFLEAGIPFREHTFVNDVYDGMVDRGWLKPYNTLENFKRPLYGEVFNDIKKEFDRLQREDPQQAIEYFKALGDTVLNDTGVHVDNNGMLGMFFLLSVADDEGDTVDWDRWLANAAGVLDLIALGFGIRFIRNMRKAAMATADVPPGTLGEAVLTWRKGDAREGAAAMIMDPEVAKAHGVRQDEVIDRTMRPRQRGETPKNGPTGVWEAVDPTIWNESGRKGFIYTDAEKANGVERVRNQLMKSNHYAYHPEKSSIGITDDGNRIAVDVVMGRTDSFGFNNLHEARIAAEELFEKDTAIEFLRRDESGNLPVVHGDSIDELAEGEYWIRAKLEKEFIPEDALAYGEGAIAVPDGFLGVAARKGLDPSSKFDRTTVLAAHRAHDMGARMQTQFLNMVKQGFDKLSNSSKRRVESIWKKGDAEGINYTPEQLLEKFPGITNKEMQVYYDGRRFSDTIYHTHNRQLYNRLEGRGVKHITNSETGFNGAGNRIQITDAFDEVGAGVINVYDADRGIFTSIGRRNAARLEERGYEMYKAAERVRQGSQASDYILTSRNGARVLALPKKVLNYRPGHVPRIYKDKYFIREVSGNRTINGIKGQADSRAIYTASTAEEARRIANKLQKNTTERDVTYVPVAAKELADGDLVRADVEALNVDGRLFFSTRGDHLKNGYTGKLAETVDPVETIQRMSHAAAKYLSHDEWLAASKMRFFKTYRKLIDMTDDELKRATDDEVFRAIKAPKDVREGGAEAAKSMWNYIRVMGGMPPVDGRAMRPVMIGLADYLSRIDPQLFKGTANFLLDNRTVAPLTLLRSAAFQGFLSLNPLRQLPLQLQQFNYLAGIEPGFIYGGELIRQASSITAAYSQAKLAATLSSKKVDNIFDLIDAKTLKIYAKSAGMDPAEFKTVLEKFRLSGMMDAIDEHMFISGGSLSPRLEPGTTNIAQTVGRGAGHLARGAVRGARKIGFDTGEAGNMLSSFLTAIHRFKKKNPGEAWHSDKHIDKIYGESRDLALAMTKSGSYEWQHGWFANMLQFFSIQQKAWNGILTNRTFTPIERGKLALGQFAVYGMSGLSLGGGVLAAWNAVNAMRDPEGEPQEMPTKVEQFMIGGMMDLMFNSAVESLNGGEQSNIRLSQDLAAGSGMLSTLEEKVIAAVMASPDSMTDALVDLYLGPSGVFADRVLDVGGRVAQSMAIAIALRNEPEISNENAKRALYTMAEVASGYSNNVKVRMWKNLKKNDVLMQFYPREMSEEAMFIKQWFGYSSAEEQDHYDLLNQLESGTVSYDRNSLHREGDEIYKRWKDTFFRHGYDPDGASVNVQVAHEMATIQSYVMMAYADDPIAKATVLNRINENLSRDIGTDRTSLAGLMGNVISNGGITSDDLAVWKQRVWNNKSFNKEEKTMLVEMIDYMMQSNVVEEFKNKETLDGSK